MKAIAFALLLAVAAAAQDTQTEKKAEPKAALELSDAQAGLLGGFVADKLDSKPSAEELEKAIQEKIAELQKSSGSRTTDPAKGKGKKKARKKAPKKGAPTSSDVLKNGLTESDRQAFGKVVVAEINAEHKGQALADAIKKELERLRAERVKASSSSDSTPKKKSEKGNE
jgi:hypothetical protein